MAGCRRIKACWMTRAEHRSYSVISPFYTPVNKENGPREICKYASNRPVREVEQGEEHSQNHDSERAREKEREKRWPASSDSSVPPKITPCRRPQLLKHTPLALTIHHYCCWRETS